MYGFKVIVIKEKWDQNYSLVRILQVQNKQIKQFPGYHEKNNIPSVPLLNT